MVEDNVGGILVTDEFGPSAHNVIAFNVSRDNEEDCGITLPSHKAATVTDPTMGGVYDNLVFGNVSEGNGGAGVGMFAPFPGTASYDNLVIDNTLKDNGEAGVRHPCPCSGPERLRQRDRRATMISLATASTRTQVAVTRPGSRCSRRPYR